MSIFDKYRDFEFDPNRDKMFGRKSAIIWGHFKNDPTRSSPVAYISKPDYLDQEEFDEILERIRISFVK